MAGRLAILGLLALAACSTDSEPAPAHPAPTRPPAATDDAWLLEARFPGPTKTKVAPVAAPVGTLEQHTELFEDKDGAFVVQWADYPAAYIASVPRDKLLDHAVQGSIAAVRGRLETSRALELGGHAGREIQVADARGGAYLARFFLVGRRLHQAIVATTPARLSDPGVRAFLDSLRLVRAGR
jgi:hypothetical protein